MTFSFLSLFQGILTTPLLLTSVILTLLVILVNGSTDAPNAIATCVGTRSLKTHFAIMLSAIFNFSGVFIMTLLNSSVAETITKMVDFGSDNKRAIIGLSASLFTIIFWAILAWFFGIPTSESHALIASLSGSAIAINNSIHGINFSEWVKVIYGLFISVALGFLLGFIICKLVTLLFKNVNRKTSEKVFKYSQIVGSAFTSFMHGAQDGQKFIGVLLLCIALGNNSKLEKINVPFSLMIITALIMALGTSIGGKKIIKSVGLDMVQLEKYQGFSADIASSLTLLFCSHFGIPVSTTHVKTTSIMGVGVVKKLSSINLLVVKDLVLTWVLTFPACAILGFLATKFFLKIF